MTKRKAIVFSIAFHAVLLTALALYWIMQKPPEGPVQPPVTIVSVQPYRPPEKPKPEKPKPPIHQAKNRLPSTVPPTPFTPAPQPTRFEGPVDPEALRDPPSPTPTFRVPPNYPDECLRNGVSGKVEARLTIAPDGSVLEVEIISATKNCFAREATKALKKWKYPAQLVTEVSTGDARTVAVQVDFNLEERDR